MTKVRLLLEKLDPILEAQNVGLKVIADKVRLKFNASLASGGMTLSDDKRSKDQIVDDIEEFLNTVSINTILSGNKELKFIIHGSDGNYKMLLTPKGLGIRDFD